MDIKTTIQQFDRLRKCVLTLCALGADALALSPLVAITRKLELRDAEGRLLTNEKFHLLRSHLANLGFMEREDMFSLVIKRNIRPILIREFHEQGIVNDVYPAAAAVLNQNPPKSRRKAIGEFHLLCYLLTKNQTALRYFDKYRDTVTTETYTNVVVGPKFDPNYVDLFADDAIQECLVRLGHRAFFLRLSARDRHYLRDRVLNIKEPDSRCRQFLYICLLIELDWGGMKELVEGATGQGWDQAIMATQLLLEGVEERARELFDGFLMEVESLNLFYHSAFVYFYLLSLALSEDENDSGQLARLLDTPIGLSWGTKECLRTINYFWRFGVIPPSLGRGHDFWMLRSDYEVIHSLIRASLQEDDFVDYLDKLYEFQTICRKHHHGFFNKEIETLLVREGLRDGKELADIRRSFPAPSLLDYVKKPEKWEIFLDGLENATNEMTKTVKGKPAVNTSAAKTNKRLVLRLMEEYGDYQIQPFEQSLGASGKWSKGRKVALKRLYNRDADYLTETDISVIRHLKCEETRNRYGYLEEIYYWDENDEFWEALGNYPLLLADDGSERRADIRAEDSYVELQRSHDGFVCTLVGESGGIRKEAPGRFVYYKQNDKFKKLARLLSESRADIPLEAEPRVRKLMEKLAEIVPVRSDLAGRLMAGKAVAGQPGPTVLMAPLRDGGLEVSFCVMPLGEDGPQLTPGEGTIRVTTEIGGDRVECIRDLTAEIAALDDIVSGHPLLFGPPDSKLWSFNNPADSLAVLDYLHSRNVPLFWPKGKKISLSRLLDLQDFSIQVGSWKEWLDVDGKLSFGDDVIALADILDRLGEGDGTYIRIDEQRFLRISERLQGLLKGLNNLRSQGRKKLQVNRLFAAELAEIADLCGNKRVPRKFANEKKRLQEIFSTTVPVPATFEADFRNYQETGFQWLQRMAQWGAGACLADDMGLGKTVQCLGLLLLRGDQGPSLVIAPSSVLINWADECRRFTPTLNPVVYQGSDRQKQLDNPQPHDLVITSYDILVRDIEDIRKMKWNCIVLDEAQAIKNETSRRSLAARSLKGAVRITTTGTPLENHLGELWTLFDFLNPGLLESRESFVKHYRSPIENQRDDRVRESLRRKVSPFILRRLKRDVLKELPSRTEIALYVELTAAERTFYGALRFNALKRVENADVKQIHIIVLAELMRLRLACCHPRLIEDNLSVSSSKMSLIQSTVQELIDNNHRALVFSQFVKHLHLMRQWLDEQGIAYDYLDGSTPVSRRQPAVNNFQAGHSSLFLISLKAGGTGLNLTAADYVLHLDPWWNPAAEDQASDRAHRIGQTRPVTIYRFITRDTIEEKILKLHERKRDLADAVLSGADKAASLSAEELISLLKE